MARGAMTHHTESQQRQIKLKIEAGDAGSLDVRLPRDANVAPPGFYMLFLVSDTGTPSVGHFVQIS